MGELNQFRIAFEKSTGFSPFPWQEKLYREWFSQAKFPSSCDLPTGLGKTSVIAIWLIALAIDTADIPRRLVYVVNRRTVVDQTTNEVERVRDNLAAACLLEPLKQLCALPLDNGASPLAISTLRGQFADNREWSADPARPAVIVGTVDMIGSRLLFGGYGAGFKTKPLHAGFLGQDVLIIHDEAHLEPAFQSLLTAIESEQQRSQEFGRLHIIALTATSRAGSADLGLTEAERNLPENLPDQPENGLQVVWRRLRARKGLRLDIARRDDVAKRIGLLARERRNSGKAILIYVTKVEDVSTIRTILTDEREGVGEDQVQILTGTMRGLERDKLIREDPIFARFLLKAAPDGQTAYLICTSAGEVGIDISADHMVCDLVPFERMVQRLGRVNRRGDGVAEIDVVYEGDPDRKKVDDALEKARWSTLAVLDSLPPCNWAADRRDASPLALLRLNLSAEQRKASFTPEPTILTATDILFDSWSLTTIRGKLPGRPPLEPYLHGLSEWEPPETYVAWREEVGLIAGDLAEAYKREDLLDGYPLKPHELLRDRSDRVYKHLAKMAKRDAEAPVWLLSERGQIEPHTLEGLIKDKDTIANRTVLLPPQVGGLDRKGFLDGDSKEANDVADELWNENGDQRRTRLWDDDPPPAGMRLIRIVDVRPYADEMDEDADTGGRRYWRWYELPKGADGDGSRAASKPVEWQVHTDDVVCNITRLVQNLPFTNELKEAMIFAARLHDLGKKRDRFQRILGNFKNVMLAKSGSTKRAFGLKEDYRHEFGSLFDVQTQSEFQGLSDPMKDLVLHVIAAHHGRGRPHFPPDEAFDPEPNGRDAESVAMEVPRRFARLQRRYGRWGLAYLESLLRAADYAASANPSAFVEDAP